MIKQIAVFILLLTFVLGGTFMLHQYALESKELTTGFSLFNVYGVNWILSFCTYVIIRISKDYLPDQLGNLFLTSVVIKPGVLILVFGDFIFEAETFKMFEKVAFLTPFALSLLAEVLSIQGILKSQE